MFSLVSLYQFESAVLLSGIQLFTRAPRICQMNITLPCIFLSRQKVMLVTIWGEKVFEDQVAETVKYKSNREDMSSLISLNVDWTKQMDL